MIPLFRGSTSTPLPVEQGVWSASAVTARDGGCIFDVAPCAATSDAAILLPHNMPAPTRAPQVTPS